MPGPGRHVMESADAKILKFQGLGERSGSKAGFNRAGGIKDDVTRFVVRLCPSSIASFYDILRVVRVSTKSR